MIGWLALLLGLVLLGISAGAGVALLRLPGSVDRALAFALLASAQVVVTVQVAGLVLRSLHRGTLLALEAAVAVALVTAARRRLAWPHVRRFNHRDVAEAARRHPWHAALAVLAGVELLWSAFLAIVLPPYAYDGLSYHLPAVVEWIQRGRIVDSPINTCCASYPQAGELLFAFPAVLLGSDSLVDAVQLPFALVGALAVGGLARMAGLSRAGGFSAGALFFLTPIVLAQATTNYVDLLFAASFLASLFFTARIFQVRGRARLAFGLLAGLAGGLTLGSKGTGIVFVAVLAVVVAGRLIVAYARPLDDRRQVAAAAGLVAVGVLAVGSYWYVHNWVDHGNPVYPFRVSVLGVNLFGGRVGLEGILTVPDQFRNEHREWVRVVRSWREDVTPWTTIDSYTYEERLGGFGPLWPLLGVPLLVVFAFVCVRRRNEILLAAIVPILLAFLLQPYHWWSRFTIPVAALGVLAVAYAAERWALPRGRAVLRAAVLALVLVGLAFTSGRLDPAGRGRALPAWRLIGLVDAPGSDRTAGALFFPGYRWADRIDSRARIGVDLVGTPFTYPLFGARWQRVVVPLRGHDLGALRRQIEAQQLGYLFVGRRTRLGRLARAAGAGVRLLYEDDRFRAYRIVR